VKCIYLGVVVVVVGKGKLEKELRENLQESEVRTHSIPSFTLLFLYSSPVPFSFTMYFLHCNSIGNETGSKGQNYGFWNKYTRK